MSGRRPNRATAGFVMTMPGLAPLTTAELAERGLSPGESGFDGRNDVIPFELGTTAPRTLLDLTTTEDVFITIGKYRASPDDSARTVADRIFGERGLALGVEAWGATGQRVIRSIQFRVVTRVRSERSFQRTELRRHLVRAVRQLRPSWVVADPARLEIWVVEQTSGRFVAGIRLSTAAMRQHGGRGEERGGALRPVVAAAMVRLLGDADGTVLDPCCGSGTLLTEAARAGWRVTGLDVDDDAVAGAKANLRGAGGAAHVRQGDARSLPFADAEFAGCASNLPFGKQFQDSSAGWLGEVLAEIGRVTAPGGQVVLLRPELPRGALPDSLTLQQRFPIRLLGTKATIWVLARR